jgi:hypothetical protein
MYSRTALASRNLYLSANLLNRNEIAMHDLLIASSLVAMLVVPCFAAMKTNVATDEQE